RLRPVHQAQRLAPASRPARARPAAPRPAAAARASGAALAPARRACRVRDLAAPLARPAAAPLRLDLLPPPPRALRVVLLQARAADASLSRLLSAGAARAGAAAASGGPLRGGRGEAPVGLRPAHPRPAAASGARARRPRPAALPLSLHAHSRRHPPPAC